MSAAQILGAVLIALPFVALAAWMVVADGWQALVIVYGGCAALLAIITAGCYLLFGSAS